MKRRPHCTALLAAVALAVTITACNPGNPDVDSLAATQGLPDLHVDLSARDWLLDPRGTNVGLGDEPISLDFHADRTASGVGPCNPYRASVAFGDGTVTFSDLIATPRACPPEVMQHEEAFFAALVNVRDVELSADHDRLVLTAPGGVRLAFDAFGPYDAIVDTWRVTNVATVDALSTLPAGADATVTFDRDRTVIVEAGCGARTGRWSLDDDVLGVSDLVPSTSCAQPASGVEAAVIAALTGSRSVQITPRTLTLVTPANTVSLIATAEP